MKLLFLLLISLGPVAVHAQTAAYPHPVSYTNLSIEGRQVRMAYMDIRPANTSNKTVLLLHGKNFNGYYWKDVISFLSKEGYRVIVPDQVGFGKSDKPNIHYSFSLLAANTKALLDSLGVQKVDVIAHSMGGMLATRFALMYPDVVNKLIYENPIGLEDYRTFVPYRSIDEQFAEEAMANFASLKKYQQSYFPEWKSEYDQYVVAQYQAMQIPDRKTASLSSALTYDMIYQQPVVYEFGNLHQDVLIVIGQSDRTIVGKKLVAGKDTATHGQYPQLGRWLQEQIAGSKLEELPGVGHIPHIQTPEAFKAAVLKFLKS